MLRRRVSIDEVVAGGVLAAAVLWILWQLHPSLLFDDTTPAFGDLGGHLHEPAFLRDHLLSRGRVAGWSQDWFTGYPSLTYYFPLGMWLVVLADLVVPYNVAMKLVVAAAPVALPLCAYAFGRLNRCDRLTSACFGIAVVPLLFQSHLFAAGGALYTTITGEFAYQLSLTLGLLVVGLARAGLRTGRYRALTAGLLAATVLFHVVPASMVVVGIGVATALCFTLAALRWAGVVLVTAGLLLAFWAVPLVLRNSLTAGTVEPKVPDLLSWLFPKPLLPVVVLAVVGAMARPSEEGDRRTDLRFFLSAMVVVSGVVIATVPEGRVGNTRFLAVFYLWLCLLAGYGLAYLGRAVDVSRLRRARGRPLHSPLLGRLVAPVAALVAMVPLWDSRLGEGVLVATHRNASIAEIELAGYEGSAHRDEFQGFIDAVRKVTDERGCGRAHFEWARNTWADLRVALQYLIPYWTDGCMPVTWGIYIQSSATSPALTVANARLSSLPIVPLRALDVGVGVADLRVLGVRYFIASEPQTQLAADAEPELRLVMQTEAVDGRYWKIYELADVDVVEPLSHLPVVVPGAGRSRTSWEATAEKWFDSGDDREVVVAAEGPAAWPRTRSPAARLPRRPVEEATVSRARVEHDRVSFRVSRTGVPVLVKVSHYPNWRVSGADGPWRVTPNQMVVVPTSKTVTLRYGYTSVEYAGWAGTLAGIGGLVFLARRRPAETPEPEPRPQPRPQPAPRRPKADPKRRKNRR